MPKMTCNGFSMFAQNERAKLEIENGTSYRCLKDLMAAVTPLWERIAYNEKVFWKQKAKEYRSSAEFREMSKPRRQKSRSRRKIRVDTDEEDSNDDEDFDDDGIELPMGPFIHTEKSTGDYNIHLKSVIDATKLLDFFTQNGGQLQDVLRSRFLMVTTQTYGDLHKKQSIPAELCLTEFSLELGILDEHCVVFGPWEIGDGELKARAELVARETHQIPLEGCPSEFKESAPTEAQLLVQVLGRTQPLTQLANHHHAAGIYANGRVTLTPAGVLKAFDEDRPLLVPGDQFGRRYLICLSRQLHPLVSSMSFLQNLIRVKDDGWPVTENRFIVLDGLVDALTSFVCQPLDSRAVKMVADVQNNNVALREDSDLVRDSCGYHTSLNHYKYCAQGQARRAVACMLQTFDGVFSPSRPGL